MFLKMRSLNNILKLFYIVILFFQSITLYANDEGLRKNASFRENDNESSQKRMSGSLYITEGAIVYGMDNISIVNAEETHKPEVVHRTKFPKRKYIVKNQLRKHLKKSIGKAETNTKKNAVKYYIAHQQQSKSFLIQSKKLFEGTIVEHKTKKVVFPVLLYRTDYIKFSHTYSLYSYYFSHWGDEINQHIFTRPPPPYLLLGGDKNT